MQVYRTWLKRPVDVCLSLMVLIAAGPLLLITWLLVRIRLGSPAFFRQARPGLGGRPFELLKFRTMTDARDADGELLPDSERLTPFGQALRSTSLDELPELVNVLRGEMSLVGPRPLLTDYLPLYSEHHARRHEVRPGITGWAQVNGRNAVPWNERLDMDVWYVENVTFSLDLRILFLTAATLVNRRGISAENHATMPRFTGSENCDE